MKISAKKAILFLFIMGALGTAVVFALASSKETASYETVLAARANVTQTVNETGTVKAINELDLSLMNSGEIARINYKIGDKIDKDSVLLELDYSSLTISRQEAAANLTVAQQNYHKFMAGATKEDLDVARASVSQAQVAHGAALSEQAQVKKNVALQIAQAEKTLHDLESKLATDITPTEQAIISAQKNLDNTKETHRKTIENLRELSLTTIKDKLVLAGNALEVVGAVMSDDQGEDYIGIKEPGTRDAAEFRRKEAVNALTRANNSLAALSAVSTHTNVFAVMNEGLAALKTTFEALELTFTALERSLTAASFSLTALDALKNSIKAQQTIIAGAITAQQAATQNLDNAILAFDTNVSNAENSLAQAMTAQTTALLNAANALASARASGEQQISAAESRIKSAKEAWQVAQAHLDKVGALPNRHDKALFEARIAQAQATLNNVDKQIESSIIKAPIAGTITKINYSIGEQVLPGGRPLISILGDSDFEIEVMISEADITKVKLNDPARITLDAYGEAIKFDGQVAFIEPAETVIQDVIYYKVNVSFSPEAHPVRSGMTANLVITTDHKENVLVVPTRAVIDRNGLGKVVRVLLDKQLSEKVVTLGLRGDEGLVEILSGLSENEEVVTFVKKE